MESRSHSVEHTYIEDNDLSNDDIITFREISTPSHRSLSNSYSINNSDSNRSIDFDLSTTGSFLLNHSVYAYHSIPSLNSNFDNLLRAYTAILSNHWHSLIDSIRSSRQQPLRPKAALNATQKQMIDDTFKLIFNDFSSYLTPSQTVQMLHIILSRELKEKEIEAMNPVRNSIKKIQDILAHPYPQNRSQGDGKAYKSFAFSKLTPTTAEEIVAWETGVFKGIVYYKSRSGRIFSEPQGILDLTSKNDSTAILTKEVVVKYIHEVIQKEIKRYQNKAAATMQFWYKNKRDEIAPIIPDEIVCPITGQIFKDPVEIPNEFKKVIIEKDYVETPKKVVVEREAIEKWVEKEHTDPFTRAPLTIAALKPAPETLKKVEGFFEKHKNSPFIYLSKYARYKKEEIKTETTAAQPPHPANPTSDDWLAIREALGHNYSENWLETTGGLGNIQGEDDHHHSGNFSWSTGPRMRLILSDIFDQPGNTRRGRRETQPEAENTNSASQFRPGNSRNSRPY